MAERKLNLHAPLMSVRRSSATSPSMTEAKKKILEKRHTLPNYKSDSSLDLVTEPVAVPFNWEHIPGRRKGNGGSQPAQPPKEATIAPSPRLPPGKSTNATKKPVEKESKVTNKFKSTSKSSSFNVNAVRLDCDRERKEEKRVSNLQADEDDNDDNDVFSDALDKLSFTGSFSMNCSASGVSGLDNFDAKKSGTFSTDPQTRDFMMSRFLPAAKAMTLQPPQYATRKHSGPLEQPREIKKLVPEEKKPLLNKHISAIIPYNGPSQEEESEDEDKGDHYEESTDISAKGCGLIPQLRIGNSLCSSNSVPGVKMSNQAPLSITYEVEKPTKSSQRRSFSPVPAVKKAWDAISKKKSSSRAASPEKQEVRKKWTSESNRFNYSGELQQPGRLSPFRRSRAAAAGVSPCRSKPQSPFRGATLDPKEAVNNLSGQLRFLQKGHVNIQKMASQEGKKSPTVEKTLYIDTASTVKLSRANSSSVDNTGKINTENCSSTKSSQGMKKIEALEGKGMSDSTDAKSLILSNKLITRPLLESQQNRAEQLVINKKFHREYASSQVVQGKTSEDSNINNQQIVVAENLGNGKVDSGLSPLPPPLPKSPSESWLWRALPLVSIKNSFLHSNQGAQPHSKRPDSNTASSNSKWETIVKTSNLHHDHVRYSQELTTRKSQHSKS